MAKDTLHELTKAELAVMKCLWSGGRQSAREIHARAGERNGWAYSTTRTTIGAPWSKKACSPKQGFHGIYVYDTEISRVQGLAHLVRSFAEQVLEMDYAPVVSLFTQSKTLTAEEIEELGRLLDEHEEGER